MKSRPIEIARRYVEALFPLAVESGALAAVESDITKLARLAEQDAAFAAFLTNPLLNRAQQQSVVLALADNMGLQPLSRGLLSALAGQKRLALLSEIARQFTAKAQAHRGELTAEVISAAPLSDAERSAVAERLGKAYGKKIVLQSRHDAGLLGGMIVKIGSKQLDATLAGKLNRLNIALKAA